MQEGDPRLTRRGGHVYFGEKRYSGLLVSFYPNGSRRSQTPYKDGLKHGTQFTWYGNAKPDSETRFVEGKKQGKHVGWHDNGAIRFQNEYDDDQPAREAFAWHDNGNIAEYIRYEGKHPHMVQAVHKVWRRDGKIYLNKVTTKGGLITGLPGDRLCYKVKE